MKPIKIVNRKCRQRCWL